SGAKGDYLESDKPDATDLYGISKRFGEVSGRGVLTIRTSMIGRELRQDGHGLLEWFLSKRGQAIDGFTKAYFSGLTTVELAHVIATVIQDHPTLSGLYHVSADRISKYELLRMLDDAFGTGTTIRPSEQLVLDRSLDSSRFRAETGWTPPIWNEMIAE